MSNYATWRVVGFLSRSCCCRRARRGRAHDCFAGRPRLASTFDIDEAFGKTMAEQLREALSKAAVRVVDLFRDWDGDNNGKVSREEFHKAMAELQFGVPASEIDDLFTEWDPDGSGVLELEELEKLLRRGSSIKLDAKLQAGGAGEIVTKSTTKHAIRKHGPGEASLLRFDVDEDSDKTVAEQLRDALAKAAVRVGDLFRDWDDDNSGTVSREEFHKAMAELQFSVPASEIDALFTEWDPDGSGALELKELEKLLRRGSSIKLDAKLQAGGAGEIVTKSTTKHAIRKGKVEHQGSVLLRGLDVDEDSDKSVAEQLRDALSKSAARVIDLFREWDDDGNGKVSKKEFHKAMGLLQFNVPAEDIDALFDSWDPDGSGLLTMDELQKELRRGSSIQLDADKTGGAGGVELSTEHKHTLRSKSGLQVSVSEPLLDIGGRQVLHQSLEDAISQSHDALAAVRAHLSGTGFDRGNVPLPAVKPPATRRKKLPPLGLRLDKPSP